MGKHALKSLSFTTVTSLRLFITASVTLFVLVATGQYETVSYIKFDHWKYIILIVISTGSLALFIYYYGLNNLPASHVTLYELFWPLSAVTMDWFIYGNIMSGMQWVGTLLLLGAIIQLSRKGTIGQTQ